MALRLTLNANTHIPIEVEGITPHAVQSLSMAKVAELPIFHGNESKKLADLFQIDGDPGDEVIEFHGDCSGVHWIGTRMESGEIRVTGSAGRHLGSEMNGGKITVEGDAGDWVGGEMQGGLIHVHGNAGHLVGAAYRGSPRGMSGGTILIDGAAGNEIGHTMRRGLIAIGGRAGDLAGFNMLAGTILLFGEVGIRHGAGMRRGTIGLFGELAPQLLPTFRFACSYQPLFLKMLFRQLEELEFSIPADVPECRFDLYCGDLVEEARGEIITRKTAG